MTAREYFNSLNLNIKNEVLKEADDELILKLADSDDCLTVYQLLANRNDIDIDTEALSVGEDGISAAYLSDDYDINLEADFEKDLYTLEIKLGDSGE